MLAFTQLPDILLSLGRDVFLDQGALAVCVLQQPHLEVVNLHGQVGYAIVQLAIGLLHDFFFNSELFGVVSFLDAELVGRDPVSFLDFLAVFFVLLFRVEFYFFVFIFVIFVFLFRSSR